MRLALSSVPGGRATLALLLVVAGVGVGAAWWVTGVFEAERADQVVQRQFQQAQTDASVLSSNMNDKLAQAEALPGLLSQEHDIQRVLSAQGSAVRPLALPLVQRAARWAAVSDLAMISRDLHRVVAAFNLSTAWIANAAGDALAEGHAPGVLPFLGTNYADRAYFKATQQRQQGRQFAVGRTTKLYGLYFAAPVTVRGQFVGMVGTSVRLDSLAPLLGDAHVLVTDEYGVVVLAADPALHMQALANAPVFSLSEAERSQRYQRTSFATMALERLPDMGPHQLYQWPGRAAHRYVWVNRPALDGALQVHVLREVGEDFEHIHQDRWNWFGLSCLVWLLFLGFVAVLSAYLAVSRQQQRALLALNGELERRANTDALTGGASRQHYLEALDLELARSQRHAMALCVLSLDVDHFKRVNDSFGHAAGDAVLRHFSAVVQGQLRQSDVFGRVGGEEFSVLLPQTDAQGGLHMAQRIRAAVEASPTDWEGQSIAITVSMGGAQWVVGSAQTSVQLLANSDKALYQAKNTGRNRVVWWWPDPAAEVETSAH